MHQLTLFAPTEPTPAPAKKSLKAKPAPTKESGLEGHREIATKSPEPAQAEAQRLIQISLNQSPTIPAKPLPSNDLSGEEWVKEYYRMPEPINPGDRVRTPAGKEGIVTRWQLDENNLPNGLPRVDWNSPDVMPGLREAYVRTDGSDEEEGFYAYHLTKIKCGNSHNSITPTVSGDELSQELTQEEVDPLFIQAQTSYEFSEKEIAWWKDREIEVRIEWLALDNSIAMVRDLATKKPYNVPVSELQPVTAKRELGDFNSAKRGDSVTAGVSSSPISNRETSAEDAAQSNAGTDANTAIISENLSHSSNKEESPIVANATGKKGGIITFGITTKRAAKMGVAEPIVAGVKICTRRQWAQRTADYYQRCYESGQTVQAYSIDTRVKDAYKMADIRITKPLYQQALKDMPESDLVAEGGLWATKEDFINTVCNGKPDPDLVVWVCWFEVVNICV